MDNAANEAVDARTQPQEATAEFAEVLWHLRTFSVDEVVSHVSQFMTLGAGDLITTGTPAGVGGGMKPLQFLAAGDIVEMSATGRGAQRHRVMHEG